MAKTMQLILREDIDNLGRPGDIVEVKPGYARNYLLPRKMAVVLTEGNRKVVEQQKASLLRRYASLKADAEQLAGMMGSLSLSFTRKAGDTGMLFGSVTSMDVADALHKAGYEIERRKVHLHDPIKQLGEYTVPVRLHREVTVEVPVKVVSESGKYEAAQAAEAAEAEAAEAPTEAEAPAKAEAEAAATEAPEAAAEAGDGGSAEPAPETEASAETEKPAE